MTAPVSSAMPMADVARALPAKIEGAAKQFEALMIAQMLRSVREENEDEQDDSTAGTMLDVADQQFSQVLAGNGGVGLATLVVKGLNQGETHADQR